MRMLDYYLPLKMLLLQSFAWSSSSSLCASAFVHYNNGVIPLFAGSTTPFTKRWQRQLNQPTLVFLSSDDSAAPKTTATNCIVLLKESSENDNNVTMDDEMDYNGNDGNTCSMKRGEIDLEREKARMESFEEYVLVSVLTASASFGILCEVDLSHAAGGGGDHTHLSVVTIVCAGLATLCGLHATVVFSLSALYGKSCIGKGKDYEYAYLLQELGEQRQRGFQSFSGSLLLFSLEVGLLLLESVPPPYQFVTFIMVGTMLYLILSDWKTIVDKAKIIYTGEIPTSTTSTSTSTSTTVTTSTTDN
jgi:hypothetical protein